MSQTCESLHPHRANLSRQGGGCFSNDKFSTSITGYTKKNINMAIQRNNIKLKTDPKEIQALDLLDKDI